MRAVLWLMVRLPSYVDMNVWILGASQAGRAVGRPDAYVGGGAVHHEPGQRGSGTARTPRKERLAWLLFVLCVIVTTICADWLMTPAHAQSQGPETFFDIPEQPLDAALEAYMRATGLQGFYKSISTTSFRSSAVKGWLSPREALDALLTGTNLTVRYPIDGAFTIVAPPDEHGVAVQASPPGRRIIDYNAFLGVVQDRIMVSLCQYPTTRPGPYRAALQFSIGSTGVINDALLLDTTGDALRDRAITKALRGLIVGDAPPPAMPQPITMLVKPRRPGFPDDCHDRH